jgi:hypothetical protein
MMLGLSIERNGIYKITDRYNQRGGDVYGKLLE